MRVLLDINILLDVFLARNPWLDDSAAVVQSGLDGKITAYLSAVSLTTIFYVVRRNANLAKAHAVIKESLETCSILPVDRSTLEATTALPDSDFEDNLQIVCASEGKLDAIVTRNPKDFAGSPLPVVTPAELLALLASTPDS
jgi:predicted nucleic acid-binding protein